MLTVEWARYRLFEYERHLGQREVQSLLGSSVDVQSVDDRIAVPLEDDRRASAMARLAQRSTYFQLVTDSSREIQTDQATIEKVHWSRRGRSGAARQATRYGVHGIHEYRGKFNPQMARAIINVVQPEARNLLDPFCGSGTTLIEGLRLGLTVHGIDKSPMAAFLSDVKTRLATADDYHDLAVRFKALKSEVAQALQDGQSGVRDVRPDWLSEVSLDYLESWFTEPAFKGLTAGLAVVGPREGVLENELAALCISSILRECSLQLPEDLRIRRRPMGFVAPSLADLFETACSRVGLALDELSEGERTSQPAAVFIGAADQAGLLEVCANSASGGRMIVTSPPYATALPYIDTDRLSIVALGLLGPDALGTAEGSLIGSREWKRGDALRWTARSAENSDNLPAAVLSILDQIRRINDETGAGFRRAAVPDLLYRYFAEMASCFDSWREGFLRSGETAVLVVGRNRTGPKSRQTVVDTPKLLGETARTRGFEVTEIIPFETWPRYGLHAANGVQGEDALVLRKI